MFLFHSNQIGQAISFFRQISEDHKTHGFLVDFVCLSH